MCTQDSIIHIIALTAPVANAGSIYHGLDGALLYYRSKDGGATFDKLHIQPNGLDTSNYRAFGGDQYAWAEPKGDTLAFVIGEDWYDAILMKSTDGGDTWNRTDQQGMAHVVFGLMRVLNDNLTDGTTSYFPFTDGLAYWREDQPKLMNLNADSLYASDHLIAWVQDLNGNGTLDFVSTSTTALGLYYTSISSMPQILIDEQDNIFVVYCSVNEGAGNGLQNYRHIWGRGKIAGGYDWDTMFDITGSLIHNYHECVFPSLSPTADANLYFTYEYDTEPGLSVRGDLDAASNNDIVFVSIPKLDFLMSVGNTPEPILQTFSVSQNYPNPFRGITQVQLQLPGPEHIYLEIRNIMGQLVMQKDYAECFEGEHILTIDGNSLECGVYFYTIGTGNAKVTRKMIVR
jgi:hypothetical protein